jgi:hypothetical protein
MSAPARVPPSEVTQLRTMAVSPTEVSLSWKPPVQGSMPMAYTVFYRVFGPGPWAVGATSTVPSAVVSKLLPGTRYEFEVMAHNR